MEKRVLVVDNDLSTRRMIAAILHQQNFAVDLCEDGQQALVCITQGEYGAVVLALVQADPAGDAAVLLRLKERPKPPCIVLLSAGSVAEMDSVASDLVKARLRKPFEMDALVSAVQSCFDT